MVSGVRRKNRCRRQGPGKPGRRGASAVEMSIVVFVFLVLVLGMLDLGLGVFRYNTFAQAARQGARQAIVHGSMADRLGTWGPAPYSGLASDAHPIAAAIRPSLAGSDLSEITIQAEWPDGGNDVSEDHRVRVTVSGPYRPMMTFIFGSPTITLRASSTMAIAH